MTDTTWFSFWVGNLWGNEILAFLGTLGVYSMIAIFGRVSYFMMLVLAICYFAVFGVGYFGILIYFPAFLFSLLYFWYELNRFRKEV